MSPHAGPYSPLRLGLEPSLAVRLPALAHGRAIVIDYFASHHCGPTVGDVNARFGSPHAQDDYVELEPLGDVPVFAERHLIGLLAEGATLRLAGPGFAQHLALTIEAPERWLEFLESHPSDHR